VEASLIQGLQYRLEQSPYSLPSVSLAMEGYGYTPLVGLFCLMQNNKTALILGGGSGRSLAYSPFLTKLLLKGSDGTMALNSKMSTASFDELSADAAI